MPEGAVAFVLADTDWEAESEPEAEAESWACAPARTARMVREERRERSKVRRGRVRGGG